MPKLEGNKEASLFFLLEQSTASLQRGDGQRAEEYLLNLQSLGIERSTLLPGLLSACILNARLSQALVYLNESPQRFEDGSLLRLAILLELALRLRDAALQDARLLLDLVPTEKSLVLFMQTAEEALSKGESLRRHYIWAAHLTHQESQARIWLRRAQQIAMNEKGETFYE